MYFKAQLNDDEMFVEALDLETAQHHLKRLLNQQNKTIPYDLVEWTELEDLPEGKIPLTFESQSKDGKGVIGDSLFN